MKPVLNPSVPVKHRYTIGRGEISRHLHDKLGVSISTSGVSFAESSVRVSLGVLLVLSLSCACAQTLKPATVVQNYSAANALREARLLGASMDVEIDAKVPKLRKMAHFDALRRISPMGRVSYESVHNNGDATVRQYVIARYLSAEAQAQTGGSLAVTPANYHFEYKGEAEVAGHRSYLFAVRPLHKREGLYRGQIWIDAETDMPIREAGRLLASSVFLKRVDFVRSYQVQDHIAVPEQLNVAINTRVVGKAELTVAYRHITLPETANAAEQVASAELQ